MRTEKRRIIKYLCPKLIANDISRMIKRIILLTTLLIHYLNGFANNEQTSYVFSKIDYQQGLSNSAVLCIYQDNQGLMWFGTYDGINCYDGKSMKVFRSDFSLNKTLNSNIIYSIKQADDNCLWVSTHLGVNRFCPYSKQVTANYEFSGDYCLYSNTKGNTWVIGKDWIKFYNVKQKKFIEVSRPDYTISNLESRAFVTDDGALWVFPSGTGNVYHYSLNEFGQEKTQKKLSILYSQFHNNPINNIYYEHGVLCFIDAKQDLYMYDISRKSKLYIRNIASMIQQYGDIKGITPVYDDIMIAFRTNGLFRLQASKRYEESIIDRNIRIFSTYKDMKQDILWLGSDGKGAISYFKKHAIATNIMLSQLSPNLSRQVRSIMTDKNGDLWFGTKGDGLVRIQNYLNKVSADKTTIYSLAGTQKASSYIKWNNEFQVYALKQSRYKNGFWVGTGNSGLSYYSYDDNQLHSVRDDSTLPVGEIHVIYEANDSTLFLATSGYGLRKVILQNKKTACSIKKQQQYRFFYEQKDIKMFYSMVPEGDSILWLGSREKGLIRFDMRTNEYKVISLKEILHKAVDDIISLHFSANGKLYAGTSSGLVIISFLENKIKAQYVGREQGLLNDMIHGILEDEKGFLWLSTNKGVIKYNQKNGFSHAYYYSSGVQIGEYSDGASYKCPYANSLFFGGIDGLIYTNKNTTNNTEHYPDILIRELNIGRTSVNLKNHYDETNSGLLFEGSEISFSLNFIAPDYITGSDIEYSYKLDGYDKTWSPFSSLNEASYTSVPDGNYIFKVRYKKDVFNTEYKYYELPIHILPLWYQTKWIKSLYILLFLIAVVYIVKLLLRYLKREKMLKKLLAAEQNNILHKQNSGFEKQNRDNINHFTTIYYVCDQLRSNKEMSIKERQQAIDIIQESMMSMLFDSNAINQNDIRIPVPTNLSISGKINILEASNNILSLVSERGIDTSCIKTDIPQNLSFPVYINAFKSILYFCYWMSGIDNGNDVMVSFEKTENKLVFILKTKRKNLLQNLQHVLQGKELSEITATFSVEKAFQIRVFQSFVCTAFKQWECSSDYLNSEEEQSLSLIFDPAVDYTTQTEKKEILILEDKDEMVWLLSGLLSSEFSIITVKSIQQAFDIIEKTSPALFIVDMQMYTNAENTFLEYIKTNHLHLIKTAFVPLLSWKSATAIQQELVLWADSYLVLPYDILFLRETVHKAIYGKYHPKQIYIDELGDFRELVTCTTTEQADFLKKIIPIIHDNIDQEDLGSSFIASQMAMSPRQLYRKFKEVSNASPSDLIKNIRMEKAAGLLQTSELSIQDVIMEVGIASRSYFYKEFSRKYGMTPKDFRTQTDQTKQDPFQKK